MLLKNKKFRTSFREIQADNQGGVEEKSFRDLGYEIKKFPDNFSCISYPTFVNCIHRRIKNFQSTDITIVIGKDTFCCHLIVLQCFSKYFEKLEASNVEMNKLDLPLEHVTPAAFCNIYEWMITKNNRIQRTMFAQIFKASIFLKVQKLMQQLMIIIDHKNIIGEREALSIFLDAKTMKMKCLQSYMINKISRIFLTFVASKEFLECSFEEATLLLSSNRIAVNSELDMVFVSIRWLKYQWPRRLKYIKSILKLIKFELVVSWQLVEFKNHPKKLETIFDPIEIQESIDEALSYLSMKQCNKSDDVARKNEPAKSTRQIIHDPLWHKFKFEKNPNIYESYDKFLIYLKQINSFHWQKLRYVESNRNFLFS